MVRLATIFLCTGACSQLAASDPYYGGSNGFETTYRQCLAYSEGLLAELGFPKDGKL